MGDFTVKILNVDEEVPRREKISAVFLIAFDGDKILSARNERGWDIPGGHLEGEETLLEGLHREIIEEAGADFENAQAFATLHADWTDKIMLFFVSNNFTLGVFEPTEDAFERDVLSIEELIERYHGDKKMLTLLIGGAKKRIS